MKFFYTISLCVLVNFLFAQDIKLANPDNDQLTEKLYKNQTFIQFKPQQELIGLRTANSKHYKLSDGSQTAIIGSGNMHYQENGQWKTISEYVYPNQTGIFPNFIYAVPYNVQKLFYPEYSNLGMVTQLPEGIIKEWNNLQMHWLDVSFNSISSINANTAKANVKDGELNYNNLYPEVGAEFINTFSERKLNYHIENINVLNTLPSNAKYLAFSEVIEVPNDWRLEAYKNGEKVSLQNNGITEFQLLSQNKVLLAYNQPLYNSKINKELAPNHEFTSQNGQYKITKLALDKYRIDLIIEVEWLKNPALIYPVLIDPTTNYYPLGSLSTFFTNSDGGCEPTSSFSSSYGAPDNTDDFAYGWGDNFLGNPKYHAYSTFNIASIPNNATINSVYYGWNVYKRRTCGDPVTLKFGRVKNNTDLQYSGDCSIDVDRIANNNSYYNGTGKNGLGWQGQTGTTVDVTNALSGNQITMGWAYNGGDDCCTGCVWGVCACTGDDGEWYLIRGRAHTNKPYVTINYCVKPTINTHPTGYSRCKTSSMSALNVSASGTGLTYQWQASNYTSCAAATGASWKNITGATSSSYTPPKIAGTVLYRVVIGSDCPGGLSGGSITSNCAVVTINQMDGSVSGSTSGHPYPAGQNAPAIQSGICGNIILPSSINILNALLPGPIGAALGVGYSWSATGGTLSTTTGPSTVWTAPSTTGVFSITLTYTEACSGANVTTVCNVTIGSPDCDYIYVSPSGTDNGGCGGPDNPCRTLSGASGAIAKVSGSRNYIRMEAGSYTEYEAVVLRSNLIIEGRYVISGGLWSKSSSTSSSTNISCQKFETTVVSGVTVGHRIGFKSNSANNWKLIDLNISTTDIAGTTSNRGRSNYALWMNNSSSYEIIRTSIVAGSASGGDNGSTGSNGGNGLMGAIGGTSGSCNSESTMYGGSGGSGGSGAYYGGYGGSGGSTCGLTCGNSGYSGGSGTNGAGGAGGTGQGGSAGCNGRRNGGAGANGGGYTTTSVSTPGINGGTESANHVFSTYYIPSSQGTSGGGGRSGGGGGGGRASTGEDKWNCNNNSGNGGSGGSGGGGGGYGGSGGWGGGSSFGIYSNSSSGALINTPISVGSLGVGGNGGIGGNGGLGGSARGGQNNCHGDRATSGAGGKGGNGARGGTGRKGANGISSQRYIVGSGSSNPSTSISNTTQVTINYQSAKLCQNSVLNIQKNAGNWVLPSGYSYVKYNNTGVASQYVASSASVDITTTNSSGSTNLTANGQVFNSYLTIRGSRTLPTITIKANDGSTLTPAATICDGGSVQLTANSWGAERDHKWEIFDNATQAPNKGSTAGLVFSSTFKAPISDVLVNTGTSDKKYTVRYQVREECCGWSIPVFATIIVKPDPTAPTALVKNPNVIEVCEGQTLAVGAPSGSHYGIPPYVYEYSYLNTDISGGFNTTSPSFAAAEGSNFISVRIQENVLKGCDATAPFDAEWIAYKDPEAGIVDWLNPTVQDICEGTNIGVKVVGATGGIPGNETDLIQYYLVTPIGGGAPSGATNGTLYSGTITPLAGDYYFRTKRTSTGLDCNDSGWSGWSLLYKVSKAPNISAVVDATYMCDNRAEISASTDIGTGVWSKVTPGSYVIVNPSSTSTGIDTLTHGTPVDIKWKVTNGGCLDSVNVNVALHSLTGSIVSDVTCDNCVMVDNAIRTYYSKTTGDYIARIEDLTTPYPTSTIGSTEVCVGLDASVQHIVDNQGADQPYLQRYWTINPNENTDVEVKLYFTETELTALKAAASSLSGGQYAFTNASELEIIKYPNGGGGTFTSPGSPGGEVIVPNFSGPVSGIYTATFKVNSFSTFYIYPASYLRPLPVELIDFTAHAVNNKFILLKWTTATEINNKGFDIERSIDGLNFEKIGHLNGNGNSNVVNHYSYQDNNVEKGVYYYRLKQVDFDGAFEYSNIRSASILGDDKLSVSNFIPNPAEDRTSINFISVSDLEVQVIIYDGIGRKVITKTEKLQKGSNDLYFNIKDLAAGVYTAKILIAKDEYTRKLVIKK